LHAKLRKEQKKQRIRLKMRFWFLLVAALFLAGCSSHRAPPPNPRLSDSITVIASLNDQLSNWRGTPYRYGGMSRGGVDCSGFVLMTFRDKFDLQLPRETRKQAEIGTEIDKDDFCPATWSFSKPDRVKAVFMSAFMIRITSLFTPRPAVE
jgi:probable lipoprotein NlpC